jgi:hypothetical protein
MAAAAGQRVAACRFIVTTIARHDATLRRMCVVWTWGDFTQWSCGKSGKDCMWEVQVSAHSRTCTRCMLQLGNSHDDAPIAVFSTPLHGKLN